MPLTVIIEIILNLPRLIFVIIRDLTRDYTANRAHRRLLERQLYESHLDQLYYYNHDRWLALAQ